jgi:hypothetical protein
MKEFARMAIFKFRSLEGNNYEFTKRIFRNLELWFSAPSAFNDPFDCKRYVIDNATYNEFISHQLNKMTGDILNHSDDSTFTRNGTNVYEDSEIKELIERINSRISSFKICCFSKNNDSILQWSHYAESHKGICIEFEAGQLGLYNSRTLLIDVLYTDELPKLRFLGKDKINIFINKKTDWAYENEIRIIKCPNNLESAQNNGEPVGFNPSSVKAIYFGLDCEKEVELMDFIRNECSNFNHVRFLKSRASSDTYGLGFVEI